MTARFTCAALLAASIPLGACGGRSDPDPDASAPASAEIRDASGRSLGSLTLTGSSTGIVLSGTLAGLPPGAHGIHIHAVGQCEPPAFESAGDHWNPDNSQHGSRNPQGPHFGDLLNLTVAEDSLAQVQGTTPGGALKGDGGLLDPDGAAVVVHAGPDDYRTDPSGDSGDRIACGVVQPG